MPNLALCALAQLATAMIMAIGHQVTVIIRMLADLCAMHVVPVETRKHQFLARRTDSIGFGKSSMYKVKL